MAHIDSGVVAATATNHALRALPLQRLPSNVRAQIHARSIGMFLEHHAEFEYSGILAILVT
jgi:hypothetical protein